MKLSTTTLTAFDETGERLATVTMSSVPMGRLADGSQKMDVEWRLHLLPDQAARPDVAGWSSSGTWVIKAKTAEQASVALARVADNLVQWRAERADLDAAFIASL